MKIYITPIIWLIGFQCQTLAQDPEILWQKQVADSALYVSQAGNDTVLAMTDTKLFALEPTTGIQKWGKDLRNSSGYPASNSNGLCFVQDELESGGNKIIAFNVIGGEMAWEHEETGFAEDICIGGDGSLYYTVHNENRFVSINQGTGSVNWSVDYGSDIHSPVVEYDGKIYIVVEDLGGNVDLVQFDGSNGDALTTIPRPSGTNWTSKIAFGSNSTLYSIAGNGKLYSYNLQSGGQPSELGQIKQTPRLAANSILIFEHDDYIHAKDLTTGSEIWKYPIENASLISTALTVTDDGSFLYEDNSDDTLYAVDASAYDGDSSSFTPTLKWSMANIHSSVIADDGTIFVGSRDGYVLAVEGTSGASQSPWPMYGGNAQRSFSGKVEETGQDQSTFTLQGWSWMETYPWIFNNAEQTWYYMMPVVNEGVAENYLYNYTTQEWRPVKGN